MLRLTLYNRISLTHINLYHFFHREGSEQEEAVYLEYFVAILCDEYCKELYVEVEESEKGNF
jgi:hypothetical protein